MRSALPFALFAVTGCDVVYGVGGRVEPDAPPEADAGPESDGPTPCTQTSATVVASADTMLLHDDGGQCNPSNRQGTYINVNLGQGGGQGTRSRVLLRFALLDDMIAAVSPGGGFTEGTLTLPLRPDACAAPCASSPISFSVYAANDDWNEGQPAGNVGAGWCMRKQVQQPTPIAEMWQVLGADGTSDRSTLSLADVTVTSAQAQQSSLEIPFGVQPGAVAELQNWVRSKQLSILLVPSGPAGTIFMKAREDSQNGGGARLTIKSCR